MMSKLVDCQMYYICMLLSASLILIPKSKYYLLRITSDILGGFLSRRIKPPLEKLKKYTEIEIKVNSNITQAIASRS